MQSPMKDVDARMHTLSSRHEKELGSASRSETESEKLTEGRTPVGNTGHRPLIRSSIPTDELDHWMMKLFPTTKTGDCAQCANWYISAAEALQ